MGAEAHSTEFLHSPGVQWELSSQPVDLSLLASTPVAHGSTTTFGQKYEGLSAIKNVEQANSWLASTMLPAVLVEAAQMEDEGRGTMDYVGAGVIGIMENLPGYEPGKSNPSLYMARAASEGMRNAARADRQSLSIDASPNTFYEGEQFLGNPGMEPSPLVSSPVKTAISSILSQSRYGKFAPQDMNPQSPAALRGIREGDQVNGLGFFTSGNPDSEQAAYDAMDILSSGGSLHFQVERGEKVGIGASGALLREQGFGVDITGMTPTRLMTPDVAEPFYERLAKNLGESAVPTKYFVDPAYGTAGPNGLQQVLDIGSRAYVTNEKGVRYAADSGTHQIVSGGGIGGKLLVPDPQGVGMMANPTLSTKQQPGYVQAWITGDDVRVIGGQIASKSFDFKSPERMMLRDAMNAIPNMFRASSGVLANVPGSAIQRFEDQTMGLTRRTYEMSSTFGDPFKQSGPLGGTVTVPNWMQREQRMRHAIDQIKGDVGSPELMSPVRRNYDGGVPLSYPYDYTEPYRYQSGPGVMDGPTWFPSGSAKPTQARQYVEQDLRGLRRGGDAWERLPRDQWNDIESGSEGSILTRQNGAYALALSLIPTVGNDRSLGTQLGGMARHGFKGYKIADLIPNRQIENNEFGMAVTGAGGDDSLRSRREWMNQRLREISGRNPAVAARAKYIGFSAGKEVDGVNLDEQFAQNVQALAEQYDLPLNYDPKHPEAFGRQFEAVRNSNPQMAAMLSEVLEMPNENKVFETLNILSSKSQARVFGAENSVTPARNNVDRNIHAA